MNGHHRDIRIKAIGETSRGTLGKDAHDIVEALRQAHGDAAYRKVLPQRSKKHGIGPPIHESPGANQQLIRDGVDYFVRSRPADALLLTLHLQNKIGPKTAFVILKGNLCWENESVQAAHN